MPFSAYFPGEEWVDYIGLDGYNWGSTPGNKWSSLEEVFSSSYAKITQLSAKPLIITETSSSEVGGDKAEWIRTGFMKTIPEKFPRVTGVIWFNKAQEDNWPLTSSQASLDAYREVVGCAVYGGTNPCATTAAVEADKPKLVVESVHVTPTVDQPQAAPSAPAGTVSYKVTHKSKVRIRIQYRTRHGRYRARIYRARVSHAGRNRLTLKRLIRHHRLRRGSYRVTIAAYGEGQRSKPRRAHFRVV
jgi:hypothetical protein